VETLKEKERILDREIGRFKDIVNGIEFLNLSLRTLNEQRKSAENMYKIPDLKSPYPERQRPPSQMDTPHHSSPIQPPRRQNGPNPQTTEGSQRFAHPQSLRGESYQEYPHQQSSPRTNKMMDRIEGHGGGQQGARGGPRPIDLRDEARNQGKLSKRGPVVIEDVEEVDSACVPKKIIKQ
jgi:hypothetical protein